MPETLHLDANRGEDIQRAAEILRAGGLVAFPTETVYGLGANALSAEAVAGIFAAKQRPAWDPLIVHVASAAEVGKIARVGGDLEARVEALAAAFWPGPLTLLLPRAEVISDAVTAGRPTVGVRVPSHPVAQRLLEASGVPLAAPSANRFGHVSPTTAQHVLDDLDGRIDAVLDGGPTRVGVESTVLDPARTPMLMYRAGAVTTELIRGVTGAAVEMYVAVEGVDEKPPGRASSPGAPSPGVGIRHYAPEAGVILSGPGEAELNVAVEAAMGDGGAVGVLLPRGWRVDGGEAVVEPWGVWGDGESLANGLFAGLRALERRGVTAIVCPLPEPGGLRDAVRDRLMKAARPR